MMERGRVPALKAKNLPRVLRTRDQDHLAIALAVFLPAALIRLALAPLTAWPNDTYTWVRLGWDALAGYGPYDRLGFSYPPGWAAVLALLLWPLLLVLPPDRWALFPSMNISGLPVVHPLFLLVTKLPAILADLGVGWLLYRQARGLALLWLFNPLVVFVSAIQGQYDSFVSLTILLSLAAALGGSAFLSGLACGIGTALKFVPLHIGPVMLAALVHQNVRVGVPRRAIAQTLSWGLGGIIGLAPALVLLSPGFWIVVTARLDLAITSSDGLNLGALRRTPWAADWRFWTDWYPSLSQALLVFIPLLFALIVLWRGEGALIPAVVGSLTAIIAFQPVTQPQYLLWVIPVALLSGSRFYIVTVTALAMPALLFYEGLVGNLLAYVSQPLSMYLERGYAYEGTVTRYLEYVQGTGVFGGPVVSDTIGLIGSLVAPVWIALLLVSLWKALRGGPQEC
ncbi:hypothetical protein HRbin26_01008 [bacterium HR26]|nr:hypothetical protein HRbin26_01008 [bacterium HR26]